MNVLWLIGGIALGVIFDRFFTRVAKWLYAKLKTFINEQNEKE
jgi:hypothetical protein